MLKKSAFCVLLGSVVWVLMLTATLSAGGEVIKMGLVQVRASKTGDEFVDPALGKLGPRLKKRFPHKSFKKIDSTVKSGRLAGSVKFTLVEGMELSIKLKSKSGKSIKITATVKKHGKPPIVEVNLRMIRGRYIVLSVPLADGDTLILAIKSS